MNIPNDLVSKWMIFLKKNPEYNERFTSCFWPSQLKSKAAIIELLNELDNRKVDNIFIFGGWYGVFADILYENFNKYYFKFCYNIDIDPSCSKVFEMLNDNVNIIHETACMSDYKYPANPDIVINTSSEHVTQEIYDAWWDKIPSGTLFIVQGNNFFESEEHIRCHSTMEEFLLANHLPALDCRIIDCGMCSDGSPFNRYLAYGVK